MTSGRVWLILTVLTGLVVALSRCSEGNAPLIQPEPSGYAALTDTVRYVGMETCRQCHESVYQTFIHTGMGQSFGLATREKSAADFTKATIYDRWHDLYYHAFWRNDSMFVREYRLKGNDTIHAREEHVSYVIGSGQHTNSHMINTHGYVTQAPMTFYTQEQRWDLPPGFENGQNSRFDRKIGLECMTCHNGYPEMVFGSENKYKVVKNGIDCERCHGPGSAHVKAKQSGKLVDISKEIDYSIVNPAKLPGDLQIDLCQRCHLQGNAVLNPGKSFLDFKPGMHLKDVMNVFVARYENDDDAFIMASHADRLHQSKCYLSTSAHPDTTAMRGDRQQLTCVTCHNPHVSVKVTGRDVFNGKCMQCHGEQQIHVEKVGSGDCVGCHMPRSGSIDIPHVRITDHRIQIPDRTGSKTTDGEKGRFLGLACVNNPDVDRITLARAYLNHFERFDPKRYLLDSAEVLLRGSMTEKNFNDKVRLLYLRQDFAGVKKLANEAGDSLLNNWLTAKSWDNDDAWTAYRVGESYHQASDPNRASEDFKKSFMLFQRAVYLAPYVPDFRNKLGVAALLVGDVKQAFDAFASTLQENPNNVQAYSNLGFLNLSRRDDPETALRYYKKAISLDPDDVPLLLNLAGLYIYQKKFDEARQVVKDVLVRHPEHEQARMVLQGIEQWSRQQ
ncbi:MAG: tetratricopeptide repeat protein [Flavobacteriales bacterium]|nr:tetratricopeptide repeat protein [Flavobacteriales bacterium]MCB9447860.1 tetratricopeptide repeat protein [Flavobacteriales bacterium]